MKLKFNLSVLLQPTFTAFFDQFTISGLNFVSVILIGRYCDKLSFAAFGLALAIWQFSVSLQRTVIILPMIVAGSDTNEAEMPAKWIWLNAPLTLLFAVSLASVALLLELASPSSYLGKAVLWSLLAAPTMLLYEFSRRLMYSLGANIDASIGAFIVGVFYSAGIAIAVWFANPAFVMIGMGAGGAVAASYGFFRHKESVGKPDRLAFEQWRKLLPNTAWHTASFLAYSTYSTALPVVVAAFSSPAVLAATVATRNITAPALTISTAVDSFEKPRAGKAFRTKGIEGLLAATKRTRRLLIIITAPIIGAIVLAAGEIAEFVHPRDPSEYVPLIWLWSLVVLATLINQPFETALLMQRRTFILFWSKVAGGIVLLLSVAILVPKLGAAGAVFSALAATMINLGLNVRMVRKLKTHSLRNSDLVLDR